MILARLLAAGRWLLFDFPYRRLLALAVAAGLLLAAVYQYGRRGAALVLGPPLAARELQRLAQVRKTDSAAAFQAGRLYQQRLDLTLLRKQDEAHDTLRPAAGPVLLPAFPAQ